MRLTPIREDGLPSQDHGARSPRKIRQPRPDRGVEEELRALKQAKLAVDSGTTKWKEQRTDACTLLVILTLRKIVQVNLVKLEIQD
jgi:hypothetical protein